MLSGVASDLEADSIKVNDGRTEYTE